MWSIYFDINTILSMISIWIPGLKSAKHEKKIWYNHISLQLLMVQSFVLSTKLFVIFFDCLRWYAIPWDMARFWAVLLDTIVDFETCKNRQTIILVFVKKNKCMIKGKIYSVTIQMSNSSKEYKASWVYFYNHFYEPTIDENFRSNSQYKKKPSSQPKMYSAIFNSKRFPTIW